MATYQRISLVAIVVAIYVHVCYCQLQMQQQQQQSNGNGAGGTTLVVSQNANGGITVTDRTNNRQIVNTNELETNNNEIGEQLANNGNELVVAGLLQWLEEKKRKKKEKEQQKQPIILPIPVPQPLPPMPQPIYPQQPRKEIHIHINNHIKKHDQKKQPHKKHHYEDYHDGHDHHDYHDKYFHGKHAYPLLGHHVSFDHYEHYGGDHHGGDHHGGGGHDDYSGYESKAVAQYASSGAKEKQRSQRKTS